MYEPYTRQSLPPKAYRELLGSAICVFNSNNSFVIENILKSKDFHATWYELIDKESGQLKPILEERLRNESELGKEIYSLFDDLVDMRNRIVHSFQITMKSGQQILATKIKNSGEQFTITEEYLHDFIKKNEALSLLLHESREQSKDLPPNNVL